MSSFRSSIGRAPIGLGGLLPVLSLACLLLAAAPAAAQEPSATEEAEREALEAELARELGATPPQQQAAPSAVSKLIPDISLVGTFDAAWFTDEPTLRFPAHEPTHNGPELQELELALQSNIDPYVRADVFFAFSLGGVEVEEAYVTTLALPWNLQLRGGEFYTPFGRFNQVHFLEVTPFADMPLPNRRFFGGEQLRGLGAELSVLLPLPFFAELRAAAQDAGNEVSFGLPADDIERISDFLATARLLTSFDLTDRLTLNLGASAANGPNTSGGALVADENRTDVFGGDLYLKLRDPSSVAFTALQAEYLFRRATVPGGRVEQGGVYAWLVRRFGKHWEAAVRFDALGLPAGSTEGEPDFGELEFLLPAAQERIGGAVSYYVSEFQRLRVQANYDFGLSVEGSPRDPVGEFFFQYQFVMGAHGAHPF